MSSRTRPSTIAIDGPAAAGKTSVGKRLARALGYLFIDTGAMYRAVTRLALENGVDLEDSEGLGREARACTLELGMRVDDPETPTAILLNGVDVTEAINSPEVERGVSQVSRVPTVREAMVERQQQLARQGQVVMVGRDIGTVVLPSADLKLYLTASIEERGRRRHAEFRTSGRQEGYRKVLQQLQQRDKLDAERNVAPMRPAEDATIVNTDGLTMEQVVDKLYRLVTGNE